MSPFGLRIGNEIGVRGTGTCQCLSRLLLGGNKQQPDPRDALYETYLDDGEFEEY